MLQEQREGARRLAPECQGQGWVALRVAAVGINALLEQAAEPGNVITDHCLEEVVVGSGVR